MTFDPEQHVYPYYLPGPDPPAPLPPNGKSSVEVAFSEPGAFVLRVVADDGAFWDTEHVDVTVTDSNSNQK